MKFYMCGEYGDQFDRPHMHACLFGINFQDRYPWRKNQNGDQLYRSEELESLWKHGTSEIGAVTFQSAAYVARYVMKKITGDLAASHYTYIDEHGEMHQRTPEYNQMSRGRGLGKKWLYKFKNDVIQTGGVITRGHESKAPRYYDKKLAELWPEQVEKYKQKRQQLIDRKENTPERLKTQEIVKHAQLKQLKRTLS